MSRTAIQERDDAIQMLVDVLKHLLRDDEAPIRVSADGGNPFEQAFRYLAKCGRFVIDSEDERIIVGHWANS